MNGAGSRGIHSPASKSASGLGSGLTIFNVYAWQIREHKGKLLITTFDDSSNMQLILTPFDKQGGIGRENRGDGNEYIDRYLQDYS